MMLCDGIAHDRPWKIPMLLAANANVVCITSHAGSRIQQRLRFPDLANLPDYLCSNCLGYLTYTSHGLESCTKSHDAVVWCFYVHEWRFCCYRGDSPVTRPSRLLRHGSTIVYTTLVHPFLSPACTYFSTKHYPIIGLRYLA